MSVQHTPDSVLSDDTPCLIIRMDKAGVTRVIMRNRFKWNEVDDTRMHNRLCIDFWKLGSTISDYDMDILRRRGLCGVAIPVTWKTIREQRVITDSQWEKRMEI